MNSRLHSALQSAAIVVAVVALDRVTKIYIRMRVSAWEIHPVIPGFFNIVHTENPGAAFGVLADSTSPWRGVFLVGVSLVVMLIIGSLLWGGLVWRSVRFSASDTALVRAGLAMVFAGAMGNLWDRLLRGTVTDFLQFYFGSYEFPSFNAADSAITIGAGLLLLDLWRSSRKVSAESRG
jgi:signal peptidase II